MPWVAGQYFLIYSSVVSHPKMKGRERAAYGDGRRPTSNVPDVKRSLSELDSASAAAASAALALDLAWAAAAAAPAAAVFRMVTGVRPRQLPTCRARLSG